MLFKTHRSTPGINASMRKFLGWEPTTPVKAQSWLKLSLLYVYVCGWVCRKNCNPYNQSTEVMKDWLFVCLLLLFLFQWRVSLNSILIIYYRPNENLKIGIRASWLLLHDPLIQRPDRYYNIVTCVQPNDYNLFVASHTYVPSYIRDFAVHIVYKTRKEQTYINDKHFNKYQYVSFWFIFQKAASLTES